MKYQQVAYLNLTDSSSLMRLQTEDDEGFYRGDVYAVGYQGDDILHIVDDDTANELIDQAGDAWQELDEWEREYVEAEE